MTAREIIANYRHILHSWPESHWQGARTMALLCLIDIGVGVVEAEQAVDAVRELVERMAA